MTTSSTIWPKIASAVATPQPTIHTLTQHPHSFFLVLSGYRSTLHDMQSAYLPANASIRTWSKDFLLNWGKGMIQWNSLLPNGLTSLFLFPQSVLLPAACRYQARRSSRSGQSSFRRMYMRVLPLPPPPPSPPPTRENTHNATNPGKEIWILFRGVSAFYLSACSADHGRIWDLFSFAYYYWPHTAGSAAIILVIKIDSFIYR